MNEEMESLEKEIRSSDANSFTSGSTRKKKKELPVQVKCSSRFLIMYAVRRNHIMGQSRLIDNGTSDLVHS